MKSKSTRQAIKRVIIFLWLIILFVVAMGGAFLANVAFIKWAANL